MKEIKKIDILSAAKLLGILMGGIYLVVGLLIQLVVFIFQVPILKTWDFLGLGAGVLSSVLVAVIVGVLFFILGAVWSWLYNLVASLSGGIKIDLVDAVVGQPTRPLIPKKTAVKGIFGFNFGRSEKKPKAEESDTFKETVD